MSPLPYEIDLVREREGVIIDKHGDACKLSALHRITQGRGNISL